MSNTLQYIDVNPTRYRWQVRRFLPMEGGRHCKSTLHGGEDGESMLPLEYFQIM